MTFTIRALTPDEPELYREIRLEALRLHPEAFGASYQDEAARPLSHFAERLAGSVIFAGFPAPVPPASAAATVHPSGPLGSGAVPAISMASAAPGATEAPLIPLGTAGFQRQAGAKRVHKATLWGMYVRRQARGTGLARALVDAVLAHAAGRVELVQLSVVADNLGAQKLYAAAGFVPYGLEAHSLKLDDRYLDEVLMVRMLP